MIPKIIVDGACDTGKVVDAWTDVTRVPLYISVNGKDFFDDGSLDTVDLIQNIKEDESIAKTAAASPGSFMEAVGNSMEAFIVTCSSKLSSTYSNAVFAAKELMEEGKKIHVFDSWSEGPAEVSLVEKIRQWISEKVDFDEIVCRGEEFRNKLHTFFVLEDLSTLTKSGRMPKLAVKAASLLSIVPICAGDEGTIAIRDLRRGINSAIKCLVSHIINANIDFSERTLYISHVNNLPRAEKVREMVRGHNLFHKIEICEAGGITTVYANQGGIVVAF